jgi:SagB-type dehydrogenase family enzyme
MRQLPENLYPLYRLYHKNLQPLVNPASVDDSSRNKEWNTGGYKQYTHSERIESDEKPEPTDEVLDALTARHSLSFPAAPHQISKDALFRILACGYRVNDNGTRPVPSAGELYPLEIYPIVLQSDDIDPGIYHYNPAEHALEKPVEPAVGATKPLDRFLRENWHHLGENHNVSVMFVISGIPSRSTEKYGERGYMFMLVEVGCLLQSLQLGTAQHGLGSRIYGGFQADQVSALLGLADRPDEWVLMSLAVGRPQEES